MAKQDLLNVVEARTVVLISPLEIQQISPAGVAQGTPCRVDGKDAKVGDYILQMGKNFAIVDPGTFKALNQFLADVEPDKDPEVIDYTTGGDGE